MATTILPMCRRVVGAIISSKSAAAAAARPTNATWWAKLATGQAGLWLLLLLLLSLLPQAPAPAVTVSTCSDLKTALNTASSNPINIPAAASIDVASCGGLGSISRTASFTLQGPASGALPTITGSKTQSIFVFGFTSVAYNFTIQNLVLTNGVGSGNPAAGGCIYAADGNVRGTAVNVTFNGCSANTGGAVYMSGGPFTARNCIFNGNQATGSSEARGGAITSLGRGALLTVIGSTFTGNSARQTTGSQATGGAIWADGNINVFSSVFNSNNVFSSNSVALGGAIYAYTTTSTTNVDQSSFSSNFALTSSSGGATTGGAIYAATLSLTNSNFTACSVNSSNPQQDQACSGGAVFAYPILTITKCNFASNAADCGTRAEARGGAVNFISQAENVPAITTSSFTSNVASGLNAYGGAIFTMQPLKLGGTSFVSNVARGVAQAQGGAVRQYQTSSKTNTIIDGIFVNNRAEGSDTVGGGAYFTTANLQDANGLYRGNSATLRMPPGNAASYRAYGGALFAYGQGLAVDIGNAQFIANSVSSQPSDAAGGAIAVYPQGGVSLFSSNFSANTATSGCSTSQTPCSASEGGGGALFVSTSINVAGCIFDSNSHFAQNGGFASGGAINAPPSQNAFSVDFSSFTNNSAVGSGSSSAAGGAIASFMPYVAITLSSSTFTSNSARGSPASGGAVSFLGGYVELSSSSFRLNTATSSSGNTFGGAISAQPPTVQLLLTASDFANNSASSAGTGVARGGALMWGGLLNSANNGPLLLASTSFTSNQVVSSNAAGGAVYLGKGTQGMSVRVATSSFDLSKAVGTSSAGGAIYADPTAVGVISFCNKNLFGKKGRNTDQAAPGAQAFTSDLEGAKEVHFCPSVPVYLDSSASYAPILACDLCDCSDYFNPCDPRATCAQVGAITTCRCPKGFRGNGFTCGNVLVCSS